MSGDALNLLTGEEGNASETCAALVIEMDSIGYFDKGLRVGERKEMGDGSQRKHIGIQEDDLGERS